MVEGEGAALPSTVAATFLQRALRGALTFVARKPALLDRLGVPERELAHPTARVSSILMVRLLDAGAELTGNPQFGLEMGRLVTPRSFSDLGYGTRFCPTVGEAVARAIERQACTQTVYRFRIDIEGRELRLSLPTMGDCPDVMRRFTELVTASSLHAMRQMAGGQLGIRHISFAHQRPTWAKHYALASGAVAEFGAGETVVVMPAEIMHRRIPFANPQILGLLDARNARFDGAATPAMLCAAFVHAEIDKAPVTLERAAAAFGTSARTLRRHLHDEGTSFRAIVEGARRDLALLYRLEGRRSVGKVALALGYSEISAYSRAHIGWHGIAPSRWEAALNAAAV